MIAATAQAYIASHIYDEDLYQELQRIYANGDDKAFEYLEALAKIRAENRDIDDFALQQDRGEAGLSLDECKLVIEAFSGSVTEEALANVSIQLELPPSLAHWYNQNKREEIRSLIQRAMVVIQLWQSKVVRMLNRS